MRSGLLLASYCVANDLSKQSDHTYHQTSIRGFDEDSPIRRQPNGHQGTQ